MEKYKNLGGNSGVEAYEIQNDAIIVEFKNRTKAGNKFYKYSYTRPGMVEVEKMKRLAVEGRGLGGYISSDIDERYEQRYRQYE